VQYSNVFLYFLPAAVCIGDKFFIPLLDILPICLNIRRKLYTRRGFRLFTFEPDFRLPCVKMRKAATIEASGRQELGGRDPNTWLSDQAEVIGHLLTHAFRHAETLGESMTKLEGKNPMMPLASSTIATRTR
jgi:hypothetical protein